MLLKLDQCRWLASALYNLGSQLVGLGRKEGAQPLLEAACQASLACALISSESQVRTEYSQLSVGLTDGIIFFFLFLFFLYVWRHNSRHCYSSPPCNPYRFHISPNHFLTQRIKGPSRRTSGILRGRVPTSHLAQAVSPLLVSGTPPPLRPRYDVSPLSTREYFRCNQSW